MGKNDVVQCDKKGRIYLREALRSRYGERFRVLEAAGELVFLPVPDDPVKALADLGKELGDVSLKAVRAAGRQRALREALGNVRRH